METWGVWIVQKGGLQNRALVSVPDPKPTPVQITFSITHRLYLKQPMYCVRSGNKTTITHQYYTQVIFDANNILCEVWEQDDYNTRNHFRMLVAAPS